MFIEKLSLAGRSAIVVGGGGGGIGTNCAMALAEAGASVVVADIDEARANDAVTQIRDRGGNARPFVGDVRDGGNVRRLVDQTRARWPNHVPEVTTLMVTTAILTYLALSAGAAPLWTLLVAGAAALAIWAPWRRL